MSAASVAAPAPAAAAPAAAPASSEPVSVAGWWTRLVRATLGDRLAGAARARFTGAFDGGSGRGSKGAIAVRAEGERLGGALPALLVAAERVAATVAPGVHGRRRVGTGDTFWQYRRYDAGDAATRIDWRRSARSDHLFVRENEWEAAQSVWLWRDGSPSMDWQSDPDLASKRDRATVLLLALSVLLTRAGEPVALLGSDGRPAVGRFARDRMVTHMMREEAATVVPPDLPPAQALPRYADLVWISDFLAPIEDITRIVRHYGDRGVRGHLLQVLDPAETLLPYSGRAVFLGLEGEESLLLARVEDIRQAYRARLTALQETLGDLCRRAGWTFGVHLTSRPPQTALLALYAALGGSTRGRGGAKGGLALPDAFG